MRTNNNISPGEMLWENIINLVKLTQEEKYLFEKNLEKYLKELLEDPTISLLCELEEPAWDELEKWGEIEILKDLPNWGIINVRKGDISQLIHKSLFKRVEPNFKITAYPIFSEGEEKEEWNLDIIKASAAWEKGILGENIKVGIIDTGIDYEHPFLNKNYKGGYNFVKNNDNPWDDNGHGTHCAGIVGASGSSWEGKGGKGVAPSSQLYALKVLSSDGSGQISSIIKAISWAIEHHISIINLSLGSRFPSSPLHQAIKKAYKEGIIITAAAGNEVIGPSFPAFYDECISTAAIDKEKKPAIFSNRDPHIDISAPGVKVYSTIPGGKFASYSGTSMAAPHIAGIAALILSKEKIKNEDFINQLKSNAEALPRHSFEVGAGLARVDRML